MDVLCHVNIIEVLKYNLHNHKPLKTVSYGTILIEEIYDKNPGLPHIKERYENVKGIFVKIKEIYFKKTHVVPLDNIMPKIIPCDLCPVCDFPISERGLLLYILKKLGKSKFDLINEAKEEYNNDYSEAIKDLNIIETDELRDDY